MSFFPEEVQTETPSRYTKLGQGATKLRILGEPCFGYETWLEDEAGARKPKRFSLDQEYDQSEVGPDGVKQFMAVKVYNYNAKTIQVWQVTQKTILKALKMYTENEDYGDPRGYDVSITRTGEGKQTRYEVVASPPKAVSKEVKSADDKYEVEPELLLINGDPFFNINK
jgi:hypothetical protein